MMDTAAMAAGIENEAAAGDVTELLKGLANGTLLSQEHCRDALDILSRQQINHKLPRKLWKPYDHDFEREEIKIAHKTGDMPGLEHDAGVFTGPGYSFVLTVMTQGPRESDQSVKQWSLSERWRRSLSGIGPAIPLIKPFSSVLERSQAISLLSQMSKLARTSVSCCG